LLPFSSLARCSCRARRQPDRQAYRNAPSRLMLCHRPARNASELVAVYPARRLLEPIHFFRRDLDWHHFAGIIAHFERRGLHVWGLVAGGSHVPRIPRARWRPADRQPTAWMLLARLYRSVGGLWWVADGYGHAVLWNVTADLGAGHPTGLYPFSGIANAIRPTQTARFHQIARRGSGGAVSRRTCAADGDRNGTR